MMPFYESDKLTEDKSFNDGEFTLYVNNLPAELNKHGLLQIFNHYGQIKEYFYRPNTNWAYISYNTYREAENAIKDLHNIPPLHLKVSFAKEKDFNEIQSVKTSTTKNIEEESKNVSAIPITLADKELIQTTRGRGKPLDIFKKIQPNPGLPKYTYTSDNDLLYPYPCEPYTYNPYENAEPYTNTNTLWTRGQLTITPDGKRHVSLGRGYTLYEIPEPNPEIHNHINKVYEKRNSGLYEYGKDMLQNAIGTCKICLKKTKYTCEKCHTFYCSRNCQVADWSQHKIECAIPALVTSMHSMSIFQSNNEEQMSTRNISNIQIPLRRPKKLINTITNSNEISHTVSENKNMDNISGTINNNNENNNDSKYLVTKTINQQKTHKKNEISIEGNNSFLCKQSINEIFNNNKSIEEIDSQENVRKWQKFNENDVMMMENEISFCNNTFLSKIKFTDVTIIMKEGCEYWVQKVEDQNSISQLMTELQKEAQNAQKIEPVIGNICAIEYEGVWHRAVITCLNPVKVHYIDYGNEEIAQTNDFRKIDKYRNIPKFCTKIRLSQKAYEKYKNLKFEDVISVKMISIDSNKIINVEVQNENDISSLEIIEKMDISTNVKIDKNVISSKIITDNKLSSSLNKVKSIISAISVGENGILEIHAEIKNDTYSITLLPNNAIPDYEKLLTELPIMCAKAECSNHKPNVGDLICGQRFDGDWLRGYILSLTPPLKMVIIDEARIMPINKTVTCDKTFSNIYAFGAICEITDTKHKFKEGDHYEFKVIAQNINNEQHEIEIEISNISKNQDKLKAIVKPWIPMPEQKGLQYAELKSGSEVCLTSYRSHNVLYARSLDTAELEHYNYVMQNIAKCAQTSPFFKKPPVVGEMVIAKFADENYYRAIVTKIQDNEIVISYIDFGNTEVTNIKKLKILSDNLKQLRSCTTKIVLKDVPIDIPMTKEVSDYLNYLTGTEVPLLCTFDGVPSKDGVYLKLHNGENVNKVISELLVPTSKKFEEDKTCYMAGDLSTIDLGNIGDIVEALVLYPIDDGYKYAICPLDYDLMTHVFDIMPKKMTEYCEANDYYIPRDTELCLAFYDGGWYRAICISRSYTPTTSAVFFVDFGNTEFIDHKDIRLMPKDFMSPYALANICNIINVAAINDNGQYSTEIEERIKELVVPDNCIKIKIVDHDLESGIYNVELPFIRDKLIEENLISA